MARRCRRGFWTLHVATGRTHQHGDQGFTLVELLIVITITPLIIGSLAFGLVTMFKLQSGVQSRLSDTEDAQVVTAAYQPDVQGATLVSNSTTPLCGSGSGNQLLGLVYGPFVSTTPTTTSVTTTTVAGTTTTTLPIGYYASAVSYDLVQSGSTWNLVREYCTNYYPATTNQTPTSSEVLAFDLPAPGTQPVATISCTSSGTTAGCSTTPSDSNPDPTTEVTVVTLQIAEPASSYSYTLAAAPESTSNPGTAGGPISVSTSTQCDFPQAGSGPLASSLCLVDFSSLFSNQIFIQDAEISGSCLEESVPLSSSFTLYFCINISNSNANELIQPFALPTYCQAFLGNPGPTAGCPSNIDTEYPNYYDIPGEPALYQQGVNGVNSGYVTTITLKYISVVNAQGVPATGWEIFSADAESTDQGSGSNTFGEGITWNSTSPIQLVPNGYSGTGYCGTTTPCDKTYAPFGNACDGQPNVGGTNGTNGTWTVSGQTYYGLAANSSSTLNYFTNEPTDTVTCTVPPQDATVTNGQSYPSTGIGTSTALDGAAMVESLTPTQFSATMTDGSGGLEAVVFGMVTS